MSQSDYSGPLKVGNGSGVLYVGQTPTYTGLYALFGVQPAVEGGPHTVPFYIFSKTGIADSSATSICTFTIPNTNQSAVYKILVRAGITNASHTYDSTRVVEYTLAITRVSGAAAVATLSSAIGAAIATSSGGQTITVTGGLSSVSGGTSAADTVSFQLTNVNASAGTTDADILVYGINALATGITVAQA